MVGFNALKRLNSGILFLAIILILSNKAVADEQYNRTMTIEKIKVDLFLNRYGGIDSTTTVKYFLSTFGSEKPVFSNMVIPENEIIDEETISVVNQLTDEPLLRGNSLLECPNKYFFKAFSNELLFCPKKEETGRYYYKIHYRLKGIDYPAREDCASKGIIQKPQLKFSLFAQNEPFWFEFTESASYDLIMNISRNCPSTMTWFALDNGYGCVNRNFLLNNFSEFLILNMTPSAVDKNFILNNKLEYTEYKNKLKFAIISIFGFLVALISFFPSISKKVKSFVAFRLKKPFWFILFAIITLILIFAYYKIITF